MKPESEPGWSSFDRSRPYRQLRVGALCFAVALGFYLVLAPLDVFEQFYEWSREYEELEIDELVLVVLLGLAATYVYGRVGWIENQRTTSLLRSSETRYRAIVENSADGISWHSPQGQFLYASHASEGIFGTGVTNAEASLQDFVHEGDAEIVEHALAETSKRTRLVRFRLRRPGAEVWCEMKLQNFLDPWGHEGVMAVTRNITERKLMEAERERLHRAVSRAAEAWRATFDSVQSPIVVLDNEKRIIRANRAAAEWLDKDARDIVGGTIYEYSDSEGPWPTLSALASQVDEHWTSLSVHGTDEESETTWDAYACTMYHAERRRWILVAKDVSRLMALQESLRQSETLSAIGSLVAGVAHEIRNPLFGMSASLDAFEERFGERGDYERYFCVIRKELQRMERLISQLFAFGKAKPLALSDESVASVLEEAMENCKPLAGGRSVEVLLRVEPNLPCVSVDRQRLVRAITNLIENAVQHSKPETSVSVDAGQATAGSIEVRITDQGEGFEERDLEKVFRPFFTRRRGGTGLGLSIVQRTVVDHGGTVLAENAPAGGGTVKIHLPLQANSLEGRPSV